VSVALLDVNVLVALLWPRHSHHRLAVPWFKRARVEGWATCPITGRGCVGVLAGPAVGQRSVSVLAAAELLDEFTRDAHHEFWPDDLPLADARFAASLRHTQGPAQLTDR
jgi:predicted nucleic acid-binding protein